jgi:hypothetical protein
VKGVVRLTQSEVERKAPTIPVVSQRRNADRLIELKDTSRSSGHGAENRRVHNPFVPSPLRHVRSPALSRTRVRSEGLTIG